MPGKEGNAAERAETPDRKSGLIGVHLTGEMSGWTWTGATTPCPALRSRMQSCPPGTNDVYLYPNLGAILFFLLGTAWLCGLRPAPAIACVAGAVAIAGGKSTVSSIYTHLPYMLEVDPQRERRTRLFV